MHKNASAQSTISPPRPSVKGIGETTPPSPPGEGGGGERLQGLGGFRPSLFIIIPCYNESAVLAETTERMTDLMRRLTEAGKVDAATLLYVDDGSTDRTWALIEEFAARHTAVEGLKLAHNAGHQQALWAGMEYADAQGADCVVTIDADLQDDPECIAEMLDHYRAGCDVVYGVRRERRTDTWFKRTTAQGFYRLMERMGAEVVYNHADFRLLSRRALAALMGFEERNVFLRGLVATLGFTTAKVYYDRTERKAGETKYPLGRMVSFALQGITSFSVQPLRYITLMGLAFLFIALCVIVYGIVRYAQGAAVEGWTSEMVSIWFIGGAILLSCGIIGEYVGKIYTEVKRRPRYFIEKATKGLTP